ncbi:MAG: hypothetical protein SFX73_40370 [Kofleriaceae bacterium]|nr:hypothetical protein [Kofleriaceae bacterium]
MQIRSVLALSLLATACASRATPPPAAPRAEPTATPTASPPQPEITRIAAGAAPGSNTHQWGSRFFELRGDTAARQVRIHDAVDFQGSGMQPSDMPPTRHTCTPWETLPADTAVTAEANGAWFRATQPAPPAAPPDPKREAVGMDSFTYGRGILECAPST